MDVILANNNRKDVAILNKYCNIIFDLNKTKEFSIQVARSNYLPEMYFDSFVYVQNEEYGGIIKNVITSTELDYVELKGKTCRGMLNTKIIQPEPGESYVIKSGDVYDIMRELVDNEYDGYIRVISGHLGIYVDRFKFNRYCTLLEGITKLLLSVGYKPIIKVIRNNGELPYFEISAEEIVDFSGKLEFTNDSNINFTMDDNRGGINHLIGLGEGELEQRMIVHKYVDQYGNITNYQHFFGVDEVAETYNYSSGDPETFEHDVEEKLLEMIIKPTMSMDVVHLNPISKIGDIVGGKDYLTGLKDAKKIENIIFSIEDEIESIDYELEGEE